MQTAPRRTLHQALEWLAEGTQLFLSGVEGLANARLDAPSALPGWSRKHLIAHVSGNAEALGRLADWAATGVPTPMYSSPDQRAADIESGATLAPDVLRSWALTSAESLSRKLGQLSPPAWQAQVTTAQGRQVPATEIPWLRSREVMLHAVDLGSGLGFRDLPREFLLALLDDVIVKRTAAGDGPALVLAVSDVGEQRTLPGGGEPRRVSAGLASMMSWLTGRPGGRVRTASGAPPPVLPPWL